MSEVKLRVLPESAFARDDFIMLTPDLVRLVGGNAARALVLIRIRYRLNAYGEMGDDGLPWWRASLDDLSEDTGMSIKSVRTALDGLVEAGLILKRKEFRGGRSDQTLSYRLVVPRDMPGGHSPNPASRSEHSPNPASRSEHSPNPASRSEHSPNPASHHPPNPASHHPPNPASHHLPNPTHLLSVEEVEEGEEGGSSLREPPAPAPRVDVLVPVDDDALIPAVLTPPKRRAKRAHQLPDGWMPDPEVIEQMKRECPSVDFRTEHAKFTDYWLGTGKPMKDWNAVWRNWIRRSRQFRPANNGGQGMDWDAAMRRAAEKDRAMGWTA